MGLRLFSSAATPSSVCRLRCGHGDRRTSRARRNAARFLFTTLVHEHFHAALATGVDRDGHAPSTAGDHRRWSAGTALNESLATWAQLDAARDEPDLFRDCAEYIATGEYPEWPYRGAQTLERQFQDHGLGSIKSLVSLLRTDPEERTETLKRDVKKKAYP